MDYSTPKLSLYKIVVVLLTHRLWVSGLMPLTEKKRKKKERKKERKKKAESEWVLWHGASKNHRHIRNRLFSLGVECSMCACHLETVSVSSNCKDFMLITIRRKQFFRGIKKLYTCSKFTQKRRHCTYGPTIIYIYIYIYICLCMWGGWQCVSLLSLSLSLPFSASFFHLASHYLLA